MNAASSITGVPNERAFTVLDVPAPGSFVTSTLVSRDRLVATCRPASTARSSSSSRSTEVSPENATRIPCTSRPPSARRPGLGKGQAARRRPGRRFHCGYDACRPTRPSAAAGGSDHSVSGWHASSGSARPAAAAVCRPGRNASASTRASSSAWWARRATTP